MSAEHPTITGPISDTAKLARIEDHVSAIAATVIALQDHVEHLTQRLERLEQQCLDHDDAFYQMLSDRISRLERLLLTALEALDQLGSGAIGLGLSESVNDSVEELREALGKEPADD